MSLTRADVPILLVGSNRLVSVSDAARVLGITRQGVHKAIERGRLEHVVIGRRKYVPAIALGIQ